MLVPPARLERWVANFADRHGGVALTAGDALLGTAPDGSTFRAGLPFAREWSGDTDVAGFAAAAVAPGEWGVLLVRKGGFAVARLEAEVLVAHKIGRRHVQGRTKAGGQSQQRFARRRDKQAREAFEAAADHAVRVLGEGLAGGGGPVVAGGDRTAVAEVQADPRLRGLRVVQPWLSVPDPRRDVLDQALIDARSVLVEVTNA